MLHVLLGILKVAGIIILTVLLVAILLVLFVLFVPIRYKAYAKKDEEILVEANVSWLLHIIDVRFRYAGDNPLLQFRIFGISTEKLKAFKNKIVQMVKPKNKKPKKRKEFQKKNLSETNGDTVIEEAVVYKAVDDKTSDSLHVKEQPRFTDKKTTVKKRKSKIKAKYKDIMNKLKSIWYKFKSICRKLVDTIKNIKEKAASVKDFLQDERNQEAFRVCKKQFFKILKHLLPRKYKIDMKFGTGDPALTGQILGLLGILMPLYKNNGRFIPDFENVVLEGDVSVKGHVTIAILLLIAWRLYRDKNIKRCYNMIMN